jgi:hypothetical protein
MNISDILPIVVGSSQIAICNAGQEINVFSLVFKNTQAAARVVTLSLFRQATGQTKTIPVELASKEEKVWGGRSFALQPGDHLDVYADATGVSVAYAYDLDTGANPIATSFAGKGTWSSATAYAINDVVYYGTTGTSYLALQAGTNKQPDTQTAYWMPLLDGAGITAAITALKNSAPASLDTLGEIATAIGNDPAFASSMATALGLKANLSAIATVGTTGNYSDLADIKKVRSRQLFGSGRLV